MHQQYCTAASGSLQPNNPATRPDEYSHIFAAFEMILERCPHVPTLIIISLNIQFATCLLIPICNWNTNFCKHATITFYFNKEPFSILEETSSVQVPIFHYRTGWCTGRTILCRTELQLCLFFKSWSNTNSVQLLQLPTHHNCYSFVHHWWWCIQTRGVFPYIKSWSGKKAEC